MEPTHRLGVERCQVLVAVPQESQHGEVVLCDHRAKPVRAQRRDGDGQRIVGIVLLGLAPPQDPHPGRQRGWHVEHLFAGAHELLGQQRPEPVGRLDGPRSFGEGGRPAPQCLELSSIGTDAHLVELVLVLVDRHRRV